ncbi:efflux RND transporter periplasmic adaptor subunit [Hymenobacter convexus]|uniref:efflux RND transporter periplasmic adaptor subunit n=1 Tax=Hymenobacter sp. CA1UV-4 TaxID=3063782 RepID=UPI00271353D7|nr:efflux RND transporter periplasmic adaptor subunit [Hymenobacter sp. CA1UV-4]MDO7852615.1 efflux RND transporter periplasmic adaptor subunit [Hymenobacter sp. CA1UV-4]
MAPKLSFLRHVLLSLLLGAAACGGKKADDGGDAGGGKGGGGKGPDGKDGGPPKILPYAVVAVQPRSTVLYNDFPATIQGQQNVEIRPKVDGFVEAIYVDEGASVKKGQPLFHISAPQYEEEVRTAQAGIKTALADVNTARMGVEKLRPLVEKDIISPYALKEAQYNLQAKEAALAQAQATLANARTNVGYTHITSPVNGVVGTIPNKIGSLVTSAAADPLTTVTGIANIYAYFSVNEKSLLNFTRDIPGTTLQDKLAHMPAVQLLLADGTVYSQKGRVETAIGQINTETGSSGFRASFANPQGLLRNGGSGTVRAPRTLPKALLVPQSATYELQGKRFIYTVGAGNKVKNTEVTVVPTPDGQFFVVQAGLKAGQNVVLEGVNGLKDNMQIKPRPAKADSVFAEHKAGAGENK